MIRVAFVDLQYPEGWLTKSLNAEHQLEACTTAEARRELLNGHLADVWKDLRVAMARLSHDKCWYCETWIDRDDLVIDHYRPKGRVFEEVGDNQGYWWLAFRARNFRLACKYCNEVRIDEESGEKGGKGTHFPLLEGSVRATAEHRSTDDEHPILLDPIEMADVDQLMFLADSSACPKYERDVDPTSFERADRTITILNLNHGRVRRTRGQICGQVGEAIERCDVVYRNYLEKREDSDAAHTAEAWRSYKDAIQRLADFLKPSSPFSGAARSMVWQARSSAEREWVDTLLYGL